MSSSLNTTPRVSPEEVATFGRETPGAVLTLSSERLEDQFVAHYDAAGNFLWVKQPVESGDDTYLRIGREDVPIEVLPIRLVYNDPAKLILLTGDFQGTLSLDNVTLNSNAARHAYVASLPLGQTAAPASTVQFSSSDHPIGEGAGHIQITATRSGDVSGAASVDYATSDGTASQKGDYQLALGTLRFAPGETSKTIRVLFVDDGFAEGVETINLVLNNPIGTALGTPDTAAITITDNETTSGAFFLSPEFQYTGHYIYCVYKGSLGRSPAFLEFMREGQQVSRGIIVANQVSPSMIETNRAAYWRSLCNVLSS